VRQVHTPNGPLGSDRTHHSQGTNGTQNGRGIQIEKKKKNKDTVGSPLTNSVQANFRGFTYSGGESVVPSASHLAQLSKDEAAVEDEEIAEPTTEDEYDEVGTAVGRLANARRKGQLLDDDIS
jgi:hypothetical protein